MWINEAEANGLPGVDDDGNGYIDGRRTTRIDCAFRISCDTLVAPILNYFAFWRLQTYMGGTHGGKGGIRWTSERTARIVRAQLQLRGSESSAQLAQETKSSSSDAKPSPSSKMALVPTPRT